MNTLEEIIKREFLLLKSKHPTYGSSSWTVSPPYLKDDFRRQVHIGKRFGSRTRLTRSYPRFILECKLERLLEDNEDAHHINTQEYDDRVDNLEPKNKHIHRADHKILLPEKFICRICKVEFELSGIKLTKFKMRAKRKTYMGPYCSKSCAGKGNFF